MKQRILWTLEDYWDGIRPLLPLVLYAVAVGIFSALISWYIPEVTR